MKLSKLGRAQWWAAAAIAVLGVTVIALSPGSQAAQPTQAKANQYIGVMKCKNCHASAEVGNQFEAWSKMKHSKAFEALASEAAKKIATEKGIADPQKDDKCLKCHVTAFGVPADQIAKGFDQKYGIQCESCHGPGQAHSKARMKAAGEEPEGAPKTFKQVPADEIVLAPDAKVCLACHNAESPTFKPPFCFNKATFEVRHLHPGKPRTAEEKKKLTEAQPCPDTCTCKAK